MSSVNQLQITSITKIVDDSNDLQLMIYINDMIYR